MAEDRRAARVPARRRTDSTRCRAAEAAAARGRRGATVPAGSLSGAVPDAGDFAEVAAQLATGGAGSDGTGPAFRFDVAQLPGGTAVAEVSGEIDLRTSGLLRDGLIGLADGGAVRIVVDFGGVRFCDATGLGALVAAHNRLSRRGGEVRLARVRPAQRRLLAVTGLDQLFALYEGVEEAAGDRRPPTASARN